jgi:hypothetical protein
MTNRPRASCIPVVPRREIQAKLMEAELSSDSGIGVTSCLIMGLKIQELQLVLCSSGFCL